MQNVWVVKNNGEQLREVFNDSQEAINFAKQSSLRAFCSIRSQGKTAIVYEYGEQVDADRAKELMDGVVEMIERENELYAKSFRGKAVRKKV